MKRKVTKMSDKKESSFKVPAKLTRDKDALYIGVSKANGNEFFSLTLPRDFKVKEHDLSYGTIFLPEVPLNVDGYYEIPVDTYIVSKYAPTETNNNFRERWTVSADSFAEGLKAAEASREAYLNEHAI